MKPWQKIARLTLAFLGMVAALFIAACNLQRCSEGAVCVADTTGPSALPSPSPSPSPSASPGVSPTPDPCLIKAVRVSFAGGSSAQLPTIPLGGEPVRIDATPINDSGPIPDGCNFARTVTWAVLTPTTCQIIGAGFNPFLRGVRVGVCTLTATVERVVSDPFSVEVR